MDYAAATPVSMSVRDAMAPFWSDHFYNASALYKDAVYVRNAIDGARNDIAKKLDCQERNIVFTAGGTESNNMAVQGVVRAWQKKNPGKKPHVVTSTIEHAAVRDTCHYLKKNGAIMLTEISVNHDGYIDMSELKGSLTEDTALVSIGFANSEIGIIQPIEQFIKTIRHFKKHTHGDREATYPVFHTDAIATPMYLDVYPRRMNADLVSLSAAKIYGPKGIALLYVRDGLELEPVMLGGGQEKGLRSGTENAPLIVGFAQALSDAVQNREKEAKRLYDIQQYFFEELDKLNTMLKEKFSFLETPIMVNGARDMRLPNNVNVSVEKLSSEQLVLELDAKGIMVSSRAACSEKDDTGSYVLQAISPTGDAESGSLRFTFGKDTTREQVATVIKTFQQVLEKLFTTYEQYKVQ